MGPGEGGGPELLHVKFIKRLCPMLKYSKFLCRFLHGPMSYVEFKNTPYRVAHLSPPVTRLCALKKIKLARQLSD